MKRFLKKLSVFCIPLLVLLAWYVYVISHLTGDLGKLGMIPFGKYEVGEIPDFADYYDSYSLDEAKNAEIVVIGDSFSKKNTDSFVNYLGHALGVKICNLYIDENKINPCVAANLLIDNELLPKCKILILESVERYSIWRLRDCFNGGNLVFVERDDESEQWFDWYKYLSLNNLSSLIKLSLNIGNSVGKLQLDCECFSHKYGDKLFYYASKTDGGGDLWYANYDEGVFLQAKANLLKLKEKAVEKGIGFYFVMPADKFDMYYEKVKDNPYPKNPAFDYFSDIDTTWYVAGKQILTPPIEDGVKDIYLVNDTHWSRIGAEIVGRHLARLIQLQHGEER